MSDQRITVGVIARLAAPLSEEERDDLRDRLEDSDLKLNYDGDIVIFVSEDEQSYDVGLVLMDKDIVTEFHEHLKMEGIAVVEGTEKVFFDHWYDGADSGHMLLTLEEAGYEGF